MYHPPYMCLGDTSLWFSSRKPRTTVWLLNPLARDKGGMLCLVAYRVNQSEFKVKAYWGQQPTSSIFNTSNRSVINNSMLSFLFSSCTYSVLKISIKNCKHICTGGQKKQCWWTFIWLLLDHVFRYVCSPGIFFPAKSQLTNRSHGKKMAERKQLLFCTQPGLWQVYLIIRFLELHRYWRMNSDLCCFPAQQR